MIMIANLQYAWTLFVEPIRQATGWKLSDIQWGFTLFILFETWVMPLEGWLIDASGRASSSPSRACCAASAGRAWRTPTRSMELYAFYAVAGIGAAFVYSGSIATALKWFPDRRGLAAGIIAAGFGSGAALFIPIIAAIIHTHGYRTAFLVTGIVQGVVIIIVAQMLRHPGRSSRPRIRPGARRTPRAPQHRPVLNTGDAADAAVLRALRHVRHDGDRRPAGDRAGRARWRAEWGISRPR